MKLKKVMAATFDEVVSIQYFDFILGRINEIFSLRISHEIKNI